MNLKSCNITFKKNQSVLEVQPGSNLMQSLRAAGLPVGSSCDGDGICGKCVLDIVEGDKELSEPTEQEIKTAEKHPLSLNRRLSCQCLVQGNIKIDAPYW